MAKFVINKGTKNNTSYYWFVMKSANGPHGKCQRPFYFEYIK